MLIEACRAMVEEMRPLLRKAGLTDREVDLMLIKADPYDRIVEIRKGPFREFAEVRGLLPDANWEFYFAKAAFSLKEVQAHQRAAARLRREWKRA